MSNSPQPQQTASGPAYEGRLLDRPDDEVIDQGVGFDIRTLLTRRGVLSLMGVGAGSMALAACGAGDSGAASTAGSSTSTGAMTSATGEIPEETNGPYPADGTRDLNILEQSGIERRDLRSNLDGSATVEGVALTMAFVVTDMAGGKPFEGAAVYAWHCDAEGRYSMYTQGVEDQTWLRGVQVADSDGKVSFTTIVPGCYSGRWPHLHFEVYPDRASATDVANVIATSQVAFPADMLGPIYERSEYDGSARNLTAVGSVEQDGIFADSVDLEMPTISGSIDAGYTATLAVNVDTATTPSAGGGMGGGGQPPAGGPPPSAPS